MLRQQFTKRESVRDDDVATNELPEDKVTEIYGAKRRKSRRSVQIDDSESESKSDSQYVDWKCDEVIVFQNGQIHRDSMVNRRYMIYHAALDANDFTSRHKLFCQLLR